MRTVLKNKLFQKIFYQNKGTFNVRIKPNLHKLAAYKSAKLGSAVNQLVEQERNNKLTSTSHNSLK